MNRLKRNFTRVTTVCFMCFMVVERERSAVNCFTFQKRKYFFHALFSKINIFCLMLMKIHKSVISTSFNDFCWWMFMCPTSSPICVKFPPRFLEPLVNVLVQCVVTTFTKTEKWINQNQYRMKFNNIFFVSVVHLPHFVIEIDHKIFNIIFGDVLLQISWQCFGGHQQIVLVHFENFLLIVIIDEVAKNAHVHQLLTTFAQSFHSFRQKLRLRTKHTVKSWNISIDKMNEIKKNI